MKLAILDVVGDPVLTFAARGAAGQALTATVLSGLCRLGRARDTALSEKVMGGRAERLGLYVPGAEPLRASYQLEAWGEVSLARTRISVGGLSQRGPYGVDDVTVQLVDDSHGSGSQWPYLSFTAYGGEPMTLRYRVTITQPVD